MIKKTKEFSCVQMYFYGVHQPKLDNSVIMENKLDLICMSSSSGIRNHFWFRPIKERNNYFCLALVANEISQCRTIFGGNKGVSLLKLIYVHESVPSFPSQMKAFQPVQDTVINSSKKVGFPFKFPLPRLEMKYTSADVNICVTSNKAVSIIKASIF